MSQSTNILNKDIELRCQCSRLLFKKLQKALEVKCPRCKRIHVFTLAQLTAFFEAGDFCALHSLASESSHYHSGPGKKINH